MLTSVVAILNFDHGVLKSAVFILSTALLGLVLAYFSFSVSSLLCVFVLEFMSVFSVVINTLIKAISVLVDP